MDSYLKMAQTVLSKMRRPLDARQILRTAYNLSIVPKNLYGKTQYKTLHARLADDIRKQHARSEFVRTDPGRFFLRRFLRDQTIPSAHKREYPARPRADQLRNFDVICLRKADLPIAAGDDLLDLAFLSPYRTLNRRLTDIYDDDSFVFLRIFVIVERVHHIVMRRSFSKTNDAMASKWSLGIIGFVKDQDSTMFSEDPYGLVEASLRTLCEQLDLTHQDTEFIRTGHLIRFLGFLVTPTDAHENSLAAVTVCHCPEAFDPIARYHNPKSLYWHAIHTQVNDWSVFDPWSRELNARRTIERYLAPTTNTQLL